MRQGRAEVYAEPPAEPGHVSAERQAPRAGPYAPASVLTAIDHIGIAVEDVDAALPYYVGVLGLPLVHRETLGEQGVEAALLDLGDSHVELIAPLGPETGVGRFLASRGPGMHHVAYRVERIERALTALADSGVQLIDERPRTGIRGSRVAFLHPSSTGGVLTEIVESTSGQSFH